MSQPTDQPGTPSGAEPEPESPSEASPWHDLEAYIALPRVTGVELSPDGSWLLAGIQTLNGARTAYTTALWRIDTDPAVPPRRLTRGEEGEQGTCILRDGSVLFTAKRPLPKATAEGDDDADAALWCLPALGGEAHVLARRRGGWGQVRTARDADVLVCSLGLRAGLESLTEDAALRSRREKLGVHAILHEGPGVRFWDHDLGSDTNRVATAGLDLSGEPHLDAQGLRLVTPDLGRSLLTDDLQLSHDAGFAVCGWQTRLPHGDAREHLVRVDLASGEVSDLVRDERDSFEAPVLSPDDRWLACTRSTPGDATTAQRQLLHLVDLTTGEHRDLAAEWPRWATPVAFSPDGTTLYVTADEDGEVPVFAVEVATDRVRRLTGHGAFSSVRLAPDGSALYAVHSAVDQPGRVVRIDPADGRVTPLADGLATAPLPGRLERVETTVADGTRVAGWLVLPEQAEGSRPCPAKLALWIHGGPLGSWNSWSWRWCPWLLAAQGWAVLMPDPALSTGYGRDMVQRGWGAWGDAPFDDLMAITDAVTARPDIDQERTVAMGGSFGGYMANWVAGHTDRFRCIVTHASLWNLGSFLGATDVPWYWGREVTPDMAARHSPHLFADRITTPMLVVHGDKDYRVPIGEGLSLWQSLTSGFAGEPEDFPHRFLYFPDENHWVLRPQHAMVWYRTVMGFLEAHVGGPRFTPADLL